MVHRRELNGREIVLGNQSDLFLQAMTWWDHETGSVWSQPTGTAILGPLAGERLELLPSQLTTWDAWRSEWPETAALDVSADITVFHLSQTVLVVDLGEEAMTFGLIDLWDYGPANVAIANVPVLVVTDPADRDRWSVFVRDVDDMTLTFEIRLGRLVDVETGTAWDPVRGIGLEGPLAGETLGVLPAFTSFPADVERFYPDAVPWSLPST